MIKYNYILLYIYFQDIDTYSLVLANCEELIYGYYSLEDGKASITADELASYFISSVYYYYLYKQSYNHVIQRIYENCIFLLFLVIYL